MFTITEDMKKILEQFPFGFAIWERRKNGLYALYRNPAADKLMGTQREKMMGKEFEEIYPDYKDRKQGLFNVLDKGASLTIEDTRYISKKKEGLFRFTLMKIDENIGGVIIEPLKRCSKTNRDGTPCPNMAVLGSFCMKHALTQLQRRAL